MAPLYSQDNDLGLEHSHFLEKGSLFFLQATAVAHWLWNPERWAKRCTLGDDSGKCKEDGERGGGRRSYPRWREVIGDIERGGRTLRRRNGGGNRAMSSEGNSRGEWECY